MPLLEHQLPVIAALSKHFRSRQTVQWGERKIHPPTVVNASVSSGKSIMIAHTAMAVCDAALAKEKPATVFVMVVQRQGILCSQNSDEAWGVGVKNSVFSASCGGRKSTHYQVVYATEGTLARALESYRFSAYTPEEAALTPDKRALLGKFHPDLLLWDEGHQVPYDNPESQACKLINHFYDCKPHMRFAAFTGSPFRGTSPITGDTDGHLFRSFASIDKSDPEYPVGGVGDGIISTEFMIDQGWVVPPVFGWPDDHAKEYDFGHLEPSGWDYDEAELDAAVSDRDKLLAICADLIEKARDRKGVLIFAATQRHARQIAVALKMLDVPESQVGVIIDKTPQKE